jgi:hypothetical protein
MEVTRLPDQLAIKVNCEAAVLRFGRFREDIDFAIVTHSEPIGRGALFGARGQGAITRFRRRLRGWLDCGVGR